MKRITALLIASVILLPTTVFSQTRKRTSRAPTRATGATKAANAQQAGATRVADQIKNLTRFIYLLGGVAKGIEAVTMPSAKKLYHLEQPKKQGQVRSVFKTSTGLGQLEIDFRSTPDCTYYINLRACVRRSGR